MPAATAPRDDVSLRKARALNDAEIIAVWNAAEDRGAFGRLVRLSLLAGTRRGEIAKLSRL